MVAGRAWNSENLAFACPIGFFMPGFEEANEGLENQEDEEAGDAGQHVWIEESLRHAVRSLRFSRRRHVHLQTADDLVRVNRLHVAAGAADPGSAVYQDLNTAEVLGGAVNEALD